MKWFNKITTDFFLVISLFFSVSAFATSRTDTVYTRFSDQEIVDILKPFSELVPYTSIYIKENETIHVDTRDFQIVVKNYHDGVILFTSFYVPGNSQLNLANEWNQSPPFQIHAHVNSGLIVLRHSVSLSDGVTKDHVLNLLQKFFIGSAIFYVKHVKKDG